MFRKGFKILVSGHAVRPRGEDIPTDLSTLILTILCRKAVKSNSIYDVPQISYSEQHEVYVLDLVSYDSNPGESLPLTFSTHPGRSLAHELDITRRKCIAVCDLFKSTGCTSGTERF